MRLCQQRTPTNYYMNSNSLTALTQITTNIYSNITNKKLYFKKYMCKYK